eukprot:augustus_masked-scaffold_3-processed-gene-4.49-mRNA-1 protein AED:1.00 eAED:1.00 QI:0/-1/0/0/-1/1/1/0/356
MEGIDKEDNLDVPMSVKAVMNENSKLRNEIALYKKIVNDKEEEIKVAKETIEQLQKNQIQTNERMLQKLEEIEKKKGKFLTENVAKISSNSKDLEIKSLRNHINILEQRLSRAAMENEDLEKENDILTNDQSKYKVYLDTSKIEKHLREQLSQAISRNQRYELEASKFLAEKKNLENEVEKLSRAKKTQEEINKSKGLLAKFYSRLVYNSDEANPMFERLSLNTLAKKLDEAIEQKLSSNSAVDLEVNKKRKISVESGWASYSTQEKQAFSMVELNQIISNFFSCSVSVNPAESRIYLKPHHSKFSGSLTFNYPGFIYSGIKGDDLLLVEAVKKLEDFITDFPCFWSYFVLRNLQR